MSWLKLRMELMSGLVVFLSPELIILWKMNIMIAQITWCSTLMLGAILKKFKTNKITWYIYQSDMNRSKFIINIEFID